jgi:enolase
MMNILNGGKHADNTVDFQEFMIQPWGFDTSARPARRRRDLPRPQEASSTKRKLSTAVGDEGGFAPTSRATRTPSRSSRRPSKKAGYKWGEQIFVALDPATSELLERGRRRTGKKGYKLLQEPPRKSSAATT